MTQKLIPLSALQHFAFCPRQCALIHNEQVWAENFLTAHGQLLHQKVDSGVPENRKGIRFERAVQVSAPTLGLVGKLDLVEVDTNNETLVPVEYKRGKPKMDDVDKIQLCAQALCLEEMTGKHINIGALWYWQTRKRLEVNIDAALRSQTQAVITKVADLFASNQTPKAHFDKRCKACSLFDLCNPKLTAQDRSSDYCKGLYITDM